MIYIVIPVHNRKEYTRGCLDSLYRQSFQNFQIIVVDDGSTDGTGEMLKEEYPRVITIKGDGNLWWTAATNLGVKYALNNSSDAEDNFVLTLNNDLEVPSNYLETILQDYYEMKPCIVGSAAVDINNHNKLLYAGLKNNYYTAGSKEVAKKYSSYEDFVSKVSHVVSDSLPGRGLLINFSVFKTIGLFDEINFMHYMADVEFAERAKRAGFKNIVSAKAVVYESYETTGMHIDRLSFSEFIGKMSIKTTNIYLPIRYKYALLHSKTKHMYFALDLTRLIVSFFLRAYKLKR